MNNNIFILLATFIFFCSFCKGEIHVFGDSHTVAFTGIPNVHIHWLGAITMHRVGRDGLDFLNNTSFGVQQNDYVVFVFGEIDVRWHIGKQRDFKFRSIDEILNTLVTKYIKTIKDYRIQYQNIHLIVYSIVPPTNNYPHPQIYGTLEDRIEITQKLNAKLLEACKKENLRFLDVYNDYALPDGSLNLTLSDGTLHIGIPFNQALAYRLNQIIYQNLSDTAVPDR